jgi:hypothetical protein
MHTIVYAYLRAILPLVKQKIIDSPLQPFRDKLLNCWPALKGSLALVYKPCIRRNCAACARGDKHPNYLLTFTDKSRRRCLYVPKAMVPLLKRALANGRRIERLLYQMGPALLRQYRTENPAQTGPPAGLRPKRLRSKS